MPDNLKAAVVQACFDDPLLQQTYRECAEHYGFLIAPCRVATPRHKGKVEQGGVHFVKRNFLGGCKPGPIAQANQDVRIWCTTTAGLRIYGTTKAQVFTGLDETDQRVSRIDRPGVEVEHIFHVQHKLGIRRRRNTPFLLQPRLKFVFLSTCRTVSCEILSTYGSSTSLSANKRNVQRAWPTGGVLHVRATRWRLALAIDQCFVLPPGRTWMEGSVQSFLHKTLPHASDGR